ncbi:MAG TPA: FAD-dependent monooxygenase [Vicinamibacterales bacterium]|nr:FAD-dependent monooxygenase [Vicinamibacterales bacterium]
MDDVLVVGAGPAGAIAGLVLARAGIRVRIVDRASFPRDKLCGDTVNPGTLARLRALGVAAEVEAAGLRVGGMVVASERQAVVGRYPRGQCGRALLRRDLDWMLLRHAMAAGCAFDPRVTVTGAVVDAGRVVGARVANGGRLAARVTIAADGRRSAIAWGLGAARHPVRPRRWAVGAYFAGVGTQWGRSGDGVGTESTPSPVCDIALGEMHVRRNCYIGIAPVRQNLTNVCLVRAWTPGADPIRDSRALLARTLADDPRLRDRFAGAQMIAAPVVLGPLAVDVAPLALDGLILAGDAAGFIDPMTGDGLRFAVRGGEIAAAAALEALARGWAGVHRRAAARRRREFGGKQRFNRALRRVVGAPALVAAATVSARVAPAMLQRVIAHAGDCRAR